MEQCVFLSSLLLKAIKNIFALIQAYLRVDVNSAFDILFVWLICQLKVHTEDKFLLRFVWKMPSV